MDSRCSGWTLKLEVARSVRPVWRTLPRKHAWTCCSVAHGLSSVWPTKSQLVAWREADDHNLPACLDPPNYCMSGGIWSAGRVTHGGRRNSVPTTIDPDIVMIVHNAPLSLRENMSIRESAAPGAVDRVLVLEPSMSGAVQIGAWRWSGLGGCGAKNEHCKYGYPFHRDSTSLAKIGSPTRWIYSFTYGLPGRWVLSQISMADERYPITE